MTRPVSGRRCRPARGAPAELSDPGGIFEQQTGEHTRTRPYPPHDEEAEDMGDPTTGDSSRQSREAARARRLATENGIDPEVFSRLITESRGEARYRRRRVPDVRLRELVQELEVRR